MVFTHSCLYFLKIVLGDFLFLDTHYAVLVLYESVLIAPSPQTRGKTLQKTVSEAHKAQVVRVLAGFSGGMVISKPKPENVKVQQYSLKEIYEKTSCNRRLVRRTLSQLISDGLVEKTTETINSATGPRVVKFTYRLVAARIDDILPYVELVENPRSRRVTTG